MPHGGRVLGVSCTHQAGSNTCWHLNNSGSTHLHIWGVGASRACIGQSAQVHAARSCPPVNGALLRLTGYCGPHRVSTAGRCRRLTVLLSKCMLDLPVMHFTGLCLILSAGGGEEGVRARKAQDEAA